ncbi:hypothetical protein [Mesorhizobium sp. SP-1A]|uniref:hypothetical protein n=1 Tax=Mesorhizobium sp. SP-1A TaxID=3077840 RepID=UPI0028F72754|nr:hypothetical protein [Mesorhizobium sp. SP-1A]
MKPTLTTYSLFGVAAAASFLSIKLLVVLGAVHWVISSMAGLGSSLQIGLAAAMTVPTLAMIWKIVRLCYAAETAPENN